MNTTVSAVKFGDKIRFGKGRHWFTVNRIESVEEGYSVILYGFTNGQGRLVRKYATLHSEIEIA